MARVTQQQAIAECENVAPKCVKRYCINIEGWNVWMLAQAEPGRALYHATKTKKPKDSRRSWEKIGAFKGWNIWRSIATTGAQPMTDKQRIAALRDDDHAEIAGEKESA